MEEKNTRFGANKHFYWTDSGRLLTAEEIRYIEDHKGNFGLASGIGFTSPGDVIVDGVVVTKTPQAVAQKNIERKKGLKTNETPSERISWNPFEFVEHHDFRKDVGTNVVVGQVAAEPTPQPEEDDKDFDLIPLQTRKQYEQDTYEPIRRIFEGDEPAPAQKTSTKVSPKHLAAGAKKAKAKSHTEQKQSTQRNRNFIKKYGIRIVAYLLSNVLAIGIFVGGQKLVNSGITKWNTHEVKDVIGELLVEPNAKKTPSLLTRHTHRTNDYQNYWFDNYGIAEDILELPDEAFDAFMYALYDEMDYNRENGYIDNWSTVINYVGQSADPQEDPLAFARANGCSNFEDYLIKNGWVTETGEPSVEAFEKWGKFAVNQYHDYLENMVEQRNADALTDTPEDSHTLGGK